MRVLVVEPEHRPEVKEIDGSLCSMQEIVGGPLQMSCPFEDTVVLARNREGSFMELPANRGLWDKDEQVFDIICGPFLLCGIPSPGGRYTSLRPEQIERYREQFATPEMFWGMDGRIVCLPMEID